MICVALIISVCECLYTITKPILILFSSRKAERNWRLKSSKLIGQEQTNLSNRSSGVQIPRDICTRFGRYLYSTRSSWIINIFCGIYSFAIDADPPQDLQVLIGFKIGHLFGSFLMCSVRFDQWKSRAYGGCGQRVKINSWLMHCQEVTNKPETRLVLVVFPSTSLKFCNISIQIDEGIRQSYGLLKFNEAKIDRCDARCLIW